MGKWRPLPLCLTFLIYVCGYYWWGGFWQIGGQLMVTSCLCNFACLFAIMNYNLMVWVMPYSTVGWVCSSTHVQTVILSLLFCIEWTMYFRTYWFPDGFPMFPLYYNFISARSCIFSIWLDFNFQRPELSSILYQGAKNEEKC